MGWIGGGVAQLVERRASNRKVVRLPIR